MTRTVFGLVVVAAAMALQSTQAYPTGSFDVYPLYYGARAWLETGSAYNLQAVAPADRFNELGNAYPFPAILFVLPLTLLPPNVAGVVWTGLMAACLMVGMQLHTRAWWLVLYLPLLEAVRIEQYTALVVAMQLGATWAVRHNRRWWSGLFLCLILTKPNHGALFVVVMLLLTRNWKEFGVCSAVVWGGSLLLSPGWPAEWLPVALNNVEAVPRPVYWQFALVLLPLLVFRDWVSLSLAAPVLLGQFRDVYVAAALPLGVLDRPRSSWLAPLSVGWLVLSAAWDPGWGTCLMLVLPIVVLSGYRWWRARRHPPESAPDGSLAAKRSLAIN